MISTCAIWGTTSYVNSWIVINVLVILISMLAIAAAYSLNGFFPASFRGRMRGFIRFELIQLIVSIVVLGALLALSASACNVSAQVSSQLSGRQMNPFNFADYYVTTIFNNGLSMLSNIYSTSVNYAILSSGIKSIPAALLRGLNGQALFKGNKFLECALTKQSGCSLLGTVITSLCPTSIITCEYSTIPSGDLSYLYNLFSSMYLDVYSPILIIATGMMFIQFLAIPIMQYSAFTIILPTALAMRSLSFFSSGLGDASNALIALAVALYIIYPMMVAFDGYAVSWIFSTKNPSAQYAGGALTVNTVAPSGFFSAQPGYDISGANALNTETSFVFNSFSAPGSYEYWVGGLNLIGTMRNYTDNMAQFFFQSIILFALDMAVTVGLAVSIYKALRSGLGEVGRFW
ncbi:MAG: hypothetical protein KGH94_02635 [Candidatus Micrarchaeota archaeon]|nr:hypothetical protein [Candidatus Micrarchaeota archaeon]